MSTSIHLTEGLPFDLLRLSDGLPLEDFDLFLSLLVFGLGFGELLFEFCNTPLRPSSLLVLEPTDLRLQTSTDVAFWLKRSLRVAQRFQLGARLIQTHRQCLSQRSVHKVEIRKPISHCKYFYIIGISNKMRVML